MPLQTLLGLLLGNEVQISIKLLGLSCLYQVLFMMLLLAFFVNVRKLPYKCNILYILVNQTHYQLARKGNRDKT